MALTPIPELCEDWGCFTDTTMTTSLLNRLTEAGYSYNSANGIFSTDGVYGSPSRGITIQDTSNIAMFCPNQAEIHLNVPVRIEVAGGDGDYTLFELRDSTTVQIDVRRLADGSVRVTRNGTTLATSTSSGVMVRGQTYFLQLRATIADAGGVVILRVNTNEVINFTGDTKQTTNAYVNNLLLRGGQSSNRRITFFNLVAYSDSGSWPLEECRWEIGDADAIGAHDDFAPLSGTSVSNVDEQQPDGLTSYISSTTVGNKSSFGTSLNVASGKTVLALMKEFWADKSDAGARSAKVGERIGSTDYMSGAIPVSLSMARYRTLDTVSPATGVAYTPTEANAAEVVIEDAA